MRHLEDSKAQDAAKRATTPPGAAAPAPAAVPSTEAKTAPRRYDFGSAEDFQLQQAMNHLKGKTVQTAKPKEAVATAPAR